MWNIKGATTYQRWRVMVVLGVISIGLGVLYAWSGFVRAGRDQAVEATVLHSYSTLVGDTDGDGDSDSKYLVTLRYTTTDGDPVETTIEFDEDPESRRMEVYYDPRAPERVRLDSPANDTSVGITLSCLGVVLLAFGLWDRRQVQHNPYLST